MSSSHLARLLQKDSAAAVRDILRLAGCAAGIHDTGGMLMAGVETDCDCPTAPVSLEGKVIGQVKCARAVAANAAAALLSFLAEEEVRKKRLVAETLDKESDIKFLQDLAEKFSGVDDVG